jgi:hypothetical protein
MEIKALYKKFLKHKGISAPKNKVQSKKPITVSNVGLWDKSKKKVIVPSNRITMKGPKGEQDFFKRPVLATGLQSGKQVMMQPGREYYFPEDEAVFEKRMQSGGITGGAEVALDLTSMVPGPIGMGASGLGLFNDLYQGDWLGVGSNTANILTGGTSKALMSTARLANNAGARNAARALASGSRSLNRTSKAINNYTKPIDTTRNVLNTPYFPTQRGGYQDNTRLAPVVRPVKPKMQTGGLFAVGPYDEMMAPKQGKYLQPDINRPSYRDEEGGRRSEYKMGFNDGENEVLVPTVVGGKQLTEDEAIAQYERTGLHMGKFKTPEEAEYASRLRTARYNMLEDPVRFSADQFQGGGTVRTSMIEEINQEESLPVILDSLVSQFQKTKQEFGVEEEDEEEKLQMQDGADTSTEQNPERIEQVHIKSKQDPWYKRYPRMVGRAIDDRLSDFGHQYAQRISNATGGSEWYKQSNPFMNVALESMNAPQLAATYAVTGKVQTPSEAMDIQNPYGAFVVDALLDPSAALTLGSRSVSRLANSALDTYANQLAKQIRKSPKLSFALEHRRPVFNTQNVQVRPGLRLDNIQPMQDYLTSNTKGSISEYDFLKKLDEGSGSLDNALKKRIADLQSKEGFNRLVNQERDFLIREGEVSSVADQLAPMNAEARIEELQNTYNVNKAAGNYIKSVNPNKLSSFARETLVDNAFHSPANPYYDYSPSTYVLDFTEPKPGSIGIGHTYVGHKPTEMHEIAHSLQRARQLPLDDELRLLKPKNFENSDYKYFSEGSNLQEPTAFANELREAMLEKGFIPDYYSPISETQVKDAYKYFKNNPSGIYDPNTGNFSSDTRIFDFMAPTKENNKILTNVLNKLPAAVPIGAGIGVGASQLNKKKSGMQMGGTMSIPGVNGTVIASSPSLYKKYKRK